MIGKTIQDRYRLDEEIGRGGLGAVYQAHDTVLQRDVAVKVLAEPTLGTEGRTRLLDEARSVAQLSHPNIVPVYDAGEDDGISYIVMEQIIGSSLKDRPPKTYAEMVAIAIQLCKALEHAHDSGIVHRDVKPENVIISEDGTVKLTDFGLARSVATRVTSEGTLVGTVFYIAPEIALGQAYDGRADLYALGVLLYELVAGELPFFAEDPVAVISQHLHAPVVPLGVKRADVPPAFAELILRLLNKDPKDRPLSAAETIDILEKPNILESAEERDLSVIDRIVRGRMIGREEEFTIARELWNRTSAGDGQLLLISGEPGIGKTRLVQEITTQAELSGGQTFLGASYAETGMPFDPYRQMLRNIFSNGVSERPDLSQSLLADMITLLPELKGRFPDVPTNPPVDPQTEQARLFDHLTILFNMLAKDAPLMLVMEDVHWSDSGSLSLLHHLARNTRNDRVMIVGTYREVELDEARPLHEMLLDLQREGLGERMKLSRLDKEATKELLAILYAEAITPEFLDGIYRETEGNPFFIEEVTKALVESGQLRFEGGRWHRPSMDEIGIPQSVRVAIQSRVAKLPEDTQEILQQAAVFGRTFEYPALLDACQVDEDSVLDSLDRAERAQLIEEISLNGQIGFTFEHALIPTSIVEGLRLLKRRRLHMRAAVVMEERHPEDYETLAHHFNQAGESEKGVEYLLKAGDRARLLYAHQEAILDYQNALDILDEKEDLETKASTLMKLGLTYHSALDFKSARKAYEEAFLVWQRFGERLKDVQLTAAPHPFRTATNAPPTLDPGIAQDAQSHTIILQLFSGLVELSPTMSVTPDIAYSWEVFDGGLRYVFHLRDDVKWSDGVPLVAADFVLAIRRLLDPDMGPGMAGLYYDIQNAEDYHRGEIKEPEKIGVRALDDHTLEFILERRSGYFLHLMGFGSAYPVPRHAFENHGENWADPDTIVTNGAYKLISYIEGEKTVLRRNRDYHGRFSGNVDEVIYTFNADEAERLNELYIEDQIDLVYCFNFPAQIRDHIRQYHADDYVTAPSLSTIYFAFDTSRHPFTDQRVRQALTHAVDREQVAAVNQRGYYFPATGGLVPPGMPGHVPDIGLPFDPDKARELLAEAGYPEGRDFPEVEALAAAGKLSQSVSEYIANQWQSVLNINVTFKALTWDEYLNRLMEFSPHIWMMGWVADYPDPDNFLRVCEWKRYGPWENEEYDRLVEEARGMIDLSQRLHLYEQAERILVQEAPIMPIAYGRNHLIVKPWVRKLPLSPIVPVMVKDVIIEEH